MPITSVSIAYRPVRIGFLIKDGDATGEILPIPLDSSNDCIDALRYGLESYIKHKVSGFDVV